MKQLGKKLIDIFFWLLKWFVIALIVIAIAYFLYMSWKYDLYLRALRD